MEESSGGGGAFTQRQTKNIKRQVAEIKKERYSGKNGDGSMTGTE